MWNMRRIVMLHSKKEKILLFSTIQDNLWDMISTEIIQSQKVK